MHESRCVCRQSGDELEVGCSLALGLPGAVDIEAGFIIRIVHPGQAHVAAMDCSRQARRRCGCLLMAALDDASIARDHPSELFEAVLVARFTYHPNISDTVFDEMVATGRARKLFSPHAHGVNLRKLVRYANLPEGASHANRQTFHQRAIRYSQ